MIGLVVRIRSSPDESPCSPLWGPPSNLINHFFESFLTFVVCYLFGFNATCHTEIFGATVGKPACIMGGLTDKCQEDADKVDLDENIQHVFDKLDTDKTGELRRVNYGVGVWGWMVPRLGLTLRCVI